jgi:hypothetical protein
MATDFALPVRRAILPRLKADPGVTALIPAAQIYPGTVGANPVFPFIRYGAPVSSPFRASGLDSSAVVGAIHAFAKPLKNLAGGVIDTAEDQAHRMSEAIGACIDGVTIVLDDTFKARVTWTGSNLLQDSAEAEAWHAVVNFRAEVAG